MAPRSNAYLHLVRLDGRGTHGWQLRVPAWHPNGPYTRYFADTRYGSPAKALSAARTERDLVFAGTGIPLRPKSHRPCGPVGLRNSSGLCGVFLQASRRSALPSWGWIAIWSENKEPHKQHFSVSVWGYEGAFWKAVELRQRQTGVLFTNEDLRQALATGRLRMREESGRALSRTKTSGGLAPPRVSASPA